MGHYFLDIQYLITTWATDEQASKISLANYRSLETGSRQICLNYNRIFFLLLLLPWLMAFKQSVPFVRCIFLVVLVPGFSSCVLILPNERFILTPLSQTIVTNLIFSQGWPCNGSRPFPGYILIFLGFRPDFRIFCNTFLFQPTFMCLVQTDILQRYHYIACFLYCGQ